MGKHRVPEHSKRQLLCVRAFPRSIAYLESLGQPNLGRAIDTLVESHKAIMLAIRPELRDKITPPAALPLETSKAAITPPSPRRSRSLADL
jgi:hypothetical protein